LSKKHPTLLYDYKADEYGKGGQLSYLATLAARHQYNVQIFAPGRSYSCIINPLDFLQMKMTPPQPPPWLKSFTKISPEAGAGQMPSLALRVNA
jgi:type IV secretory pathway TraG/TraD family ATPase VirD4